MEYPVHTRQQVLDNPALTAFVLDTLVHNLSWLYGSEMDSPDNRDAWVHHNLQAPDPFWRLVVATRDSIPVGFLIFTVKNRTLYINDIQILPAHRMNPALLRGLLRAMFGAAGDNFDTMRGYINRGNATSQRNFLRFATSVEERANGMILIVDEKETERIRQRFSTR